jgi:tyrosyl-tRNA synthetase
MKINTDSEKIESILTRGVSEAIDRENLKKRLLSGKQLRAKLGFDPTSPNLHLGRSVVLLKLRDFQELGHKIVFIVGDFTGTIGDTSDKDSERPMLSEQTVKANLKTYIQQVGKLLDIKQVEVQYNSKWLKKLTFAEIGQQADQFSLAEFIARENIKKRLDAGKRVSLRELLYPLMQGYDSVAVKADVELGGTDQRFNLLAGRKLQSHYGQPAQDILMTNLILGTDGRKMSSSWGNTINLLDEPKEMYGKVMSIPDALIISYFVHCTRYPMEKIAEFEKQLAAGKVNPKEIKSVLAREITTLFWGKKGGDEGQKYFATVFENKENPEQILSFRLAGKTLTEVLVQSKLAASNSEARRLIEQGGIKIDKQTITDPNFKVKPGSIVQKGKRGFVKVA